MSSMFLLTWNYFFVVVCFGWGKKKSKHPLCVAPPVTRVLMERPSHSPSPTFAGNSRHGGACSPQTSNLKNENALDLVEVVRLRRPADFTKAARPAAAAS